MVDVPIKQRRHLHLVRSALLVALLATAVFSSNAHARDDRNDDGERMREASREQQRRYQESQREQERQQILEQEREHARQTREQQRDLARQAREQEREQQREQARQAREQQREQSQQAREQQRAQSGQSQTRANDQQQQGSSQSVGAAATTTSSTSGRTNSGSETQNRSSDDNRQRASTASNNKPGNSKPGQTEKNTKKDDEKEEKNAKVEAVPEGPPATVEQWIKQLTSSKPPKVEIQSDKTTEKSAAQTGGTTEKGKAGATTKAAVTTDDTKSNEGKAVTAKSGAGIAKSNAAKPSQVARPAPIEIPTAPLPEVLAVNASKQTVERAKSLGFKAKASTSLSSLDFAVTTLLPPQGMSAVDAQALLSRELPAASFAPNQKYRIYKTASSTRTLPAGTRAASVTPGAAACGDDRCFASNVIGWRPELRSCASGVKIGVIDTSVDTAHPAFAGKKLQLKHFGREGTRGPDWHGTGITALLAGDALSGTPGLIPNASFLVADIFHADADDEPASDTISMLRAFDWLESKGVKIINMSLSGPPDDLIRKAIEKLAAKGVLLVAAAGNDGPAAGPSYPAAYDQVIAVTAVNRDLQSYRYANRGAYIDVAAPGVSIWTALPGSQGGYHSGTSFATPYVTAALATLYPRLASKTPQAALQQITYRDLGTPGPDPIYGQGLLVAPHSCDGDMIATIPGNRNGLTVSSSPSASTTSIEMAPAETLPWLGLQNSGN